MELDEKLYSLSERIKQLKEKIQTEEATKQSFIMPFFQALGYDVFNPLEFVPEFTADVGIKKGEKVDYAILKDNEPIILIEAKPCNDDLSKHDSQLFRYFGTTRARFAILTNGIIYKFFSDLDQPNIMDKKPFYILDMENLSEQSIAYVEKFIKANLDIDNILNTASDLKYLNLTKLAFKELMENPSDEFVRLLLNTGIYDGVKNQKVIDKFKPITKRAMNQYINEKLSSKFKETLTSGDNEKDEDIEDSKEESKIVTTIDELNSYAIVKSILRKEIEPQRIFYKDTESYFGILLDNNIRKWILRINLNSRNKHIIIPDENKKGIRYDIDTIDDIYNYEKEIIDSLKRYM
ncbi:endonuclease [Erysipelatoclostridium sp. An15]|uniref:type I restriction endonuclease n=1 Tax=Erysipelatoclostridium sp. An15 TaxID=1965566 RepID=UPI000B380239|nr:type I restriction endonuclease [Erysipelatoclostridium sp. An15]OUQ08262.1 endonuclease [Erysipelatoclostridium sp. An15]